MAWPTQYPTNAGDLLLGPLADVLREHFRETRARAERQDVRRQAKEQYDQHFAFLKEQAAQQATQRMYATKDPTAALAQLPEVESYRARLGATPLGTGSMQPTPARSVPTVQEGPPEMVPQEAPGPPTAAGEPALRMVPSGLPTWVPAQANLPEQPPEHAVARSYWQQIQQQKAQADLARIFKERQLMTNAAPSGAERVRIAGHAEQALTPADTERHAQNIQAETDADRQAKILARLAGRRPPAGPRPQKPPKLTLNEAYALIDSGDPTANEAIRRMVPEANTPEKAAGVVDNIRRKRTADLLAKAARFANDKASQAATAELRAAQADYDKVAKNPVTRWDDAAKADPSRRVGAAAAALQNAMSAAASAPGFAVPGQAAPTQTAEVQPAQPATETPDVGVPAALAPQPEAPAAPPSPPPAPARPQPAVIDPQTNPQMRSLLESELSTVDPNTEMVNGNNKRALRKALQEAQARGHSTITLPDGRDLRALLAMHGIDYYNAIASALGMPMRVPPRGLMDRFFPNENPLPSGMPPPPSLGGR